MYARTDTMQSNPLLCGAERTTAQQLTDIPGLDLEPLLTAREVAAILGVSPKRVYELGIPSVRVSTRSVRWRPSVLKNWINERSGDS